MKYFMLALLLASTAWAQDIVSVQDNGTTVLVAQSNGVTVHVPRDDRNTYYQAVQRWITDGGVITPAPDPRPEERRSVRSEILDMYRRLYALRQLQADPERPFDVTNEIDAATARITVLRQRLVDLNR